MEDDELFSFCQKLFQENKYNEVIELLQDNQAAVALSEIRLLLARCQLNAGKLTDSLETLLKTQRTHLNLEQLLSCSLITAEVSLECGQYETTCSALEDALLCQTELNLDLELVLIRQLITIYVRLERTDLALAWAGQLGSSPDDRLLYLSILLQHNAVLPQEFTDVMKNLKPLCMPDAKLKQRFYELSVWVYARLHMEPQAEVYLEQLLKIAPGSSTYGIASLYYFYTKKWEKARLTLNNLRSLYINKAVHGNMVQLLTRSLTQVELSEEQVEALLSAANRVESGQANVSVAESVKDPLERALLLQLSSNPVDLQAAIRLLEKLPASRDTARLLVDLHYRLGDPMAALTYAELARGGDCNAARVLATVGSLLASTVIVNFTFTYHNLIIWLLTPSGGLLSADRMSGYTNESLYRLVLEEWPIAPQDTYKCELNLLPAPTTASELQLQFPANRPLAPETEITIPKLQQRLSLLLEQFSPEGTSLIVVTDGFMGNVPLSPLLGRPCTQIPQLSMLVPLLHSQVVTTRRDATLTLDRTNSRMSMSGQHYNQCDDTSLGSNEACRRLGLPFVSTLISKTQTNTDVTTSRVFQSRSKQVAGDERALFFAAPTVPTQFNFDSKQLRLHKLVELQREASRLAAECGSSHLYVAQSCTKNTFLREAANATLLYLGVYTCPLTGRLLFSTVQGCRQCDCVVTASEISALKLKAKLVVLANVWSRPVATTPQFGALISAFISGGAQSVALLTHPLSNDQRLAAIKSLFARLGEDTPMSQCADPSVGLVVYGAADVRVSPNRIKHAMIDQAVNKIGTNALSSNWLLDLQNLIAAVFFAENTDDFSAMPAILQTEVWVGQPLPSSVSKLLTHLGCLQLNPGETTQVSLAPLLADETRRARCGLLVTALQSLDAECRARLSTLLPLADNILEAAASLCAFLCRCPELTYTREEDVVRRALDHDGVAALLHSVGVVVLADKIVWRRSARNQTQVASLARLLLSLTPEFDGWSTLVTLLGEKIRITNGVQACEAGAEVSVPCPDGSFYLPSLSWPPQQAQDNYDVWRKVSELNAARDRGLLDASVAADQQWAAVAAITAHSWVFYDLPKGNVKVAPGGTPSFARAPVSRPLRPTPALQDKARRAVADHLTRQLESVAGARETRIQHIGNA